MKLTYPILGRMIEGPGGGSDGYEVEGDYEFNVEPTNEDYELYLIEKYGNDKKAGVLVMLRDYYDEITASIDDEDDFYDFMKERYEDDAKEEMEWELD